MSLRPAVFLDRDGVVNRYPGAGQFVLDWSGFEFMPGVREELLRLRAAGYVLVLVTNQSGVGRGLMTQAALDEIHARMQEALGAAKFDAIYFCPHHPDTGCPCRKPSPWMVRKAAEEHGLELARSFLIGDSGRDVAMGRAAGCRTILCRANLPARAEDLKPEHRPDRMFASLPEAADWILSGAKDPHQAGTSR
jgi:histidinol-phosphate phosphatase family protein